MSAETTLLVIIAALLVGGFALIDTGSRIEAAALRTTQTDTPTEETPDDDSEGSRDDDPAPSTEDL